MKIGAAQSSLVAWLGYARSLEQNFESRDVAQSFQVARVGHAEILN